MNIGLQLWLDDTRRPPDSSWYWAKTAEEAIYALQYYEVRMASLDHDLADYPDEDDYMSSVRSHKERTGYDVVLWMAENDHWPTEGIVIHSWNPEGGRKMAATVDRYGPYPTKCRHIPHQNP